eukprot:gene19036-biopygen6955
MVNTSGKIGGQPGRQQSQEMGALGRGAPPEQQVGHLYRRLVRARQTWHFNNPVQEIRDLALLRRQELLCEGARANRRVDAALATTEMDVRAKYAPTVVRPWVLSSLGRPGEAMCADLRRLARRRLALPDAQRAVSPPSILALLMQRWRAELSCTLVAGDADVYLDVLREGPQSVG